MNNTPEKNTNSYRDYNLSGAAQQNFSPNRPQASRTQNPSTPARQPNPAHQAQNQAYRQPAQQVRQQPAQQRRPLNDEERRRLEAARMAAMQTGGRMTDEEIRRRRLEQQHLNAAQPGISRQTAQPGVNPQRRVEIQNPTGGQQSMPRKRRRKIRINAGAVVFVLLIAGVVGVSAWQLNRDDTDTPNSGFISLEGENNSEISGDIPEIEEPVITETEAETEPIETEPAAEDESFILYDTVTVSNTTVDDGNLILVNYDHAYADTDTVSLANVYNQRKSGVKVSSTAVSLTADTLDALDNMLFGLTAETGCDDLIINSGHRNTADQQRIYDDYVVDYGPEYAKSYVANAGYSEHHTGLACDLSFFTDDGYMIPIAEHESGWWLGANCAKYGFILRYPQEKVDITRIAYEAWHFRYVGVPHALAVTSLGYCYEEYVNYIKSCTPETGILHIKPDGSSAKVDAASLPVEGGGWLVYYVPANDGENTDIRLFRGDLYADYEISGSNDGGFIVTVTLP